MTYYIVSFIWCLLSLLPFRILYLISDLIYFILYRLVGYRVRIVRSNLESSFPEKTTEELRSIERKFYHKLCDYFVEALKTMTMSERQMRRHMVFRGTELIDQYVAEGQSCAFYLGHMFNWEWVSSLPLWVTDKAHLGQLYHALENPTFDRLFLHLRQRWGAESIALTDVLRKIIECKQNNKPSVFGYIADQVPHWNNIHHWCWFLNHDTPVMTGGERIAVKNRQAVVFCEVLQVRRGYYEATIKLMTRTPEKLKEFELTDIYHRMLEENIRKQPELWLWSHNRWKRTREEFDRRFQVVNGKVVPKEDADEL